MNQYWQFSDSDPISLVAYKTSFAFMAQTFILAFESLE